ncbi:helix-turn-helix domain-containing protein [Hymenobacter jejuensis]|uniref:Helix-turn-helix transcriptional regulator n=1 Tax=Hymenobacter jejuensis TaxID=2502781 RepID=A0A5B7ZU23_9BACT|nr:AraC family transcriptional regulator [Hymenobacter jejuensis]QDA58684.1 helix-turn-helix transcriptional regulator [Hymenobacter jejuensis]
MLFEFNAYSSLLLPFFLQGIVFAALLVIRARQNDTASDRWLALLLLLNTLPLMQWMLGFANWYDSHDAHSTFMFYFPFSHWLALGPVFYFYFRSLTNREFRFSRAQLWHFAPEALYLAWIVLVGLYDVVWQHEIQGQPFLNHYGTKGRWACINDEVSPWIEAGGYVSVVVYAWLTLREYRQYRHYINNYFSDTERIKFSWLRNLLYAVLLGLGIVLLFNFVNLSVVKLTYVQFWYSFLATGVLVYYLSIAGLLANYQLVAPLRFQPEAVAHGQFIGLSEIPDNQIDVQDGLSFLKSQTATVTTAEPQVSKADVTAEPDLQRWAAKLTRLMETDRPYLAPELTLSTLAAQLRTNTSLLSRVINSCFGQNFNDYVNTYRVAEAERKLQNPNFRHYTLLAVALESGFNSKSTFNRVFKKLRGATPSEIAAGLNS